MLQGLMPSCWGPALWHSLHSIAMAYDPSYHSKKDFYDFFKNLGNVLPCEECKKHYNENFLKQEKLLVDSLNKQNGLFRWVYDLHNIVNKQTNAKDWPTYESVVKKYENFKVSCGNIPGVCGSGGANKKRIRIVEEFGNVINNDYITIFILSLLLFISLCFNIYKSFKKIKNR